MLNVYDLLKGNDLRSIGKANEVVKLVTSDPKLFDEVFNGLFHEDKVIRARCADAVEKVGRKYPEFIQKKKSIIFNNLHKFEQKEVRWHIAVILGYIQLTKKELEKAVEILFKWLNEEESIIVKVMCMQTLADLSLEYKSLKKSVQDEVQKHMINGAPAIIARGKKLLKYFN
jgi:hypothetical protein